MKTESDIKKRDRKQREPLIHKEKTIRIAFFFYFKEKVGSIQYYAMLGSSLQRF